MKSTNHKCPTVYKTNKILFFYLKKVDKFSNNTLGLRLVFTVFDVHVKSSFLQ